ncbi:MAG: hypothetical protein EPN25_05710 [Nitrospirae bacterium]|nr:MAG: hypothetical protein EPN25_05710 [Nitrospirota bacterium]
MKLRMSRRSWVVLSLCSIFLAGQAAVSSADYQLITKDGKTLTWESFEIDDGNYCTWKKNGKFCLPLSDVKSVKEITASSDDRGPSRAYQSEPAQQSGQKRGVMTKSVNQGSVDGQSSYVGRGGYGRGGSTYHSYDANSSNTTYSTEVDASDMRRMDYEADAARIRQNDRRAAMEQERQAELSRQRAADEQRRLERERRDQEDMVRRQSRRW